MREHGVFGPCRGPGANDTEVFNRLSIRNTLASEFLSMGPDWWMFANVVIQFLRNLPIPLTNSCSRMFNLLLANPTKVNLVADLTVIYSNGQC